MTRAPAFVAKNGFRNDDFRPFLYRTTDFGKTWTAITGNLVDSPINVVVQDRKNRNLLIVGNDLGVWVSIDGGAAWQRLKADLPTVPVHDLTIHPRENDLVLGTYGRGIFVGDITHLQELSAGILAKPLHLFAVEPRAAYGFRALGNFHLFGNKYIRVPNEPDALVINYYLRAAQEGGAQVTISDSKGDRVAQLKGPSNAGINRVQWNMRGGAGESAGGRGTPEAGVAASVDRCCRRATIESRLKSAASRRRPSAGSESAFSKRGTRLPSILPKVGVTSCPVVSVSRSRSVTTRSSARSGPAEWGRCIAPVIRSSIASLRSRFFRMSSPAIRSA